ncbi:hypothetical protein LXL04_016306 [Taraxacum kok-saghyz]
MGGPENDVHGSDRVKIARIQTLNTEFEALNMKETEAVDEFVVKVSNIVSTMRALGDTVVEAYVVKKILRAVPSKFLQIASTREQFVDLDEMTVEEVIGRMKAHEEQINGHGETEDRKLLMTHQERCGHGRGGSHEKDGSGSNSQDKRKVHCYNFQDYGHYAAESKNPRRERNQENHLIQDDDESALLLSSLDDKGEIAKVFLNEESVKPSLKTGGGKPRQSKMWILTLGSIQGYVKFGNEARVRIEGKGTIVFQCKNGEQRKLQEVYYIPDLCSNIISLGQLSECGDEIKIKEPFLWVHDRNGRLLMKVQKCPNRLYKIELEEQHRCRKDQPSPSVPPVSPSAGTPHLLSRSFVFPSQSSDLYHPLLRSTCCREERLLPGNSILQEMCRSPEKNKPEMKGRAGPCGDSTSYQVTIPLFFLVLLVRNQHTTTLPPLTTTAMVAVGSDNVNSSVSIDSWFPECPSLHKSELRSRSYGHNTGQGLFSFREIWCPEYKRGVWIFVGFLKFLVADSVPVGKQYFIWKQTSYRAKRMLELINIDLCGPISPPTPSGNRYFMLLIDDYNRIAEVSSCPTNSLPSAMRTTLNVTTHPHILHNQNGVVERRNRTVLEMVRSNLKTMTVPDVLWGEAVSHVVYVLNRVNTKALKDSTLYEIWTGRKPHVGHLRVFGCVAHMMITKDHLKKLDERIFEEGQSWAWEKTSKIKATPGMTFTVEGFELGDFDDKDVESDPSTPPAEYGLLQDDGSWTASGLQPINSPVDSQFSPRKQLTEETLNQLMFIQDVEEPSSYKEAKMKQSWIDAMMTELLSIEKNNTWNLVELPKGRKPIGVKWVLEKRDPRSNGWRVHHLDVKSAFLNGNLEEEVYVTQPEGFEKKGEINKVYKLSKALYGLKQATRAWNSCLDKYLKILGFNRCPLEYSVYTRKKDGNTLIIGAYLDDLLVTRNCHEDIEGFKLEIKAKFKMSYLGLLTYYLGIELVNPTEYRTIVGGLRYLTHTRPDLSFGVGVVSRFMEKPTMTHLHAIKGILRYIKGTMNYGLVYTKGVEQVTITGYSDSDLANDVNDRKCTGGMVFYVNGNLVTWASQKQRCVALSSCEAEFMVATMTACQGIWLRRLLLGITGQEIPPVTIYVDNRSALDLMKNPVFDGRSKHIDIWFHFVRECVENGEINFTHISGKEQKADMLTKPFARVKYERNAKFEWSQEDREF